MAFILHVHGNKEKGGLKFTSWPLHFSQNIQALFYVVMAEEFDIIQHQLVQLPNEKRDIFVEVKTVTECCPVIMHVVGLMRIGEGVQMYYKVVAEAFIDITEDEENDDKLDGDSVIHKDTSVVELGTSEGNQVADAIFDLQDEEGPEVLLSHKHGSKYWVRTPPGRDGLCTQKLILLQQVQNKQLYMIFTSNSWNFKSIPFMMQPGREYRCLVIYSTSDKTSDFLQIGAMTDGKNNFSLPDEFKVHHFAQASKEKVTSIYFTKQELDEMRLKAVQFVHRKKQRVAAIPYFYRNKDLKYYHNIMKDHNDGIMYPTLKDNNGDRYSILNSNIEGIFFSALLLPSTLRPPDTSIFGTRRCYIRSTMMLNSDTNMYFADFYCYNNVVHYVTIVLTRPGSEPDQFCNDNLVKIDIYSNPFLQLATFDGVQKVLVTLNVVIEVFYTEPIDLMALSMLPGAALFEDVKVIGRGSSVEGGLPKKEDCDLCNL